MKHMKSSQHSQTLISVIIPVYNVEPYLRRCMDCVCGQTHTNLDIICVDDGSTDNSLSILREYELKDPRVRVLAQPNTGVASARNKALDIARGEWITGMDPDDWMMTDAYETLLKHADADADVDLILFGSQVIAEDDRITPEQAASMQRYMDNDFVWEGRQAWEPYMTQRTTCTLWNKLFRRATWEKSGLRFDEGLWNNSDFCFYLQFGAHVRNACFVNLHPHRYSLRGDSISFAKSQKSYERRCRSHLITMERILTHYKELSLVEECLQLLKFTVWHTAERLWGYRARTADRNMWADEFFTALQRCGFDDDKRFTNPIRSLMEKFRGGRMVECYLNACREQASPCRYPERLQMALVVNDALLVPGVLTLQSLREVVTPTQPVCAHVLAAAPLSPHTRSILEKLETPELAIQIHELAPGVSGMLPPSIGLEPRAGYLLAALPELLPNVHHCLCLQAGMLVKEGITALQSWEAGEAMVGAVPLPEDEKIRELCLSLQKREWWRYQVVNRYYSPTLLWLNLEAMREANAAAAWLDASLMRLEAAPYSIWHALNLALQNHISPLPEGDEAYVISLPGHQPLSAPGGVTALIPETESPLWPQWNSYYERSPLAAFPLKDVLPPPPPAPQKPAATPKPASPPKPAAAPKPAEAPKPVDMGVLSMLRGQITRRYYRYRLLACVTWGKRHRHYVQKKKQCKLLLRSLEDAAATNYAMWRARH